ncbi:unnamed protein product [Lampetra planeri]
MLTPCRRALLHPPTAPHNSGGSPPMAPRCRHGGSLPGIAAAALPERSPLRWPQSQIWLKLSDRYKRFAG